MKNLVFFLTALAFIRAPLFTYISSIHENCPGSLGATTAAVMWRAAPLNAISETLIRDRSYLSPISAHAHAAVAIVPALPLVERCRSRTCGVARLGVESVRPVCKKADSCYSLGCYPASNPSNSSSRAVSRLHSEASVHSEASEAPVVRLSCITRDAPRRAGCRSRWRYCFAGRTIA